MKWAFSGPVQVVFLELAWDPINTAIWNVDHWWLPFANISSVKRCNGSPQWPLLRHTYLNFVRLSRGEGVRHANLSNLWRQTYENIWKPYLHLQNPSVTWSHAELARSLSMTLVVVLWTRPCCTWTATLRPSTNWWIQWGSIEVKYVHEIEAKSQVESFKDYSSFKIFFWYVKMKVNKSSHELDELSRSVSLVFLEMTTWVDLTLMFSRTLSWKHWLNTVNFPGTNRYTSSKQIMIFHWAIFHTHWLCYILK